MECLDSGMVLLKDDLGTKAGMTTETEGVNPTFPIFGILGKVLNVAYGQETPGAILLLWE